MIVLSRDTIRVSNVPRHRSRWNTPWIRMSIPLRILGVSDHWKRNWRIYRKDMLLFLSYCGNGSRSCFL